MKRDVRLLIKNRDVVMMKVALPMTSTLKMNPKRLTCLSIILCVFFMVKLGLLVFIDVPILSFFCGLVVPLFGWKRIIVIRFVLVSLIIMTDPILLVSLIYAPLQIAFLFTVALYALPFCFVAWFYKRFKKWLIF